MSFDFDYSRDTEFTKLLARRADIDLTVAALELARDADPDLDFQSTFDWIAARGEELSGPIAKARTDQDAIKEVCRCLAETHGIYGEEAAYNCADSSYLNRIVETGRGIPIGLSVLYMAVAKTVNIELEGINAPMHFLTRYESSDGPLYIDTYTHGRIMTEEECLNWLWSLTGQSNETVRASLKSTEPRSIIIRMLNNLKALHVRQEDWSAALPVQQRLISLQPTSYDELRDFGLISLKGNQPGQALELFQRCLKNCPEDDEEILHQQIEEAKKHLARWN